MLFQLRDEHIQALENASLDNFVDRTCRHLRSVLPTQTFPYGDDQLSTRVRQDIDRARPYGFTTERSIVRFVETGFLIGPDFDRSSRFPWVNPTLHLREYNQEDRSLVLVTSASEAAKKL